MPIVFTYRGYRFFFFSNDGDPREPAHIHVRKDTKLAKFWVVPEVTVATSYGYSARELNQLVEVVEKRKDIIVEKWHEFFGI